MDDFYDIFQKLPDGAPMWVQTVPTLDAARDRIAALAEEKGENFAIYHSRENRFVEPFPDGDGRHY